MLADTIYYAGDFNVDLLDPDKPPSEGRHLLDLLDIYNLECLINKATRKTKTSETLNKRKALISGVVDTQISNHSLVFTALRSSAPKSHSRKILCRSLKNYNQEKFLQDLHMVPFQIIDIFDDVDDTLYAFEQLYIEILNEHAPLKQMVIRGNQVSYMTEEWCKEIRYRNKL